MSCENADRSPIDVVVAWVDGADPANRAKRNKYLCADEALLPDIAGDERYDSSGEIKFCIGSILRFAPFVRKIYIVTDEQNPNLEEFIDKNFGASHPPVAIVDHKEIFKGYEQYLPTFDSLSIETMLWRIPGLCEHFVYFNDDVFLLRSIRPDDWFDGNSVVCYASRFSRALATVLRAIKPRRHGHKPFGHKDAMLNSARLLSIGHFWNFSHAPLPLRRSLLADFFERHPETIIYNIKHRFREATQYNPQELLYLLAEQRGECAVRSPKGKTLFLKPTADKPGYMARKLRQADTNRHLMFCCINSLGECSDADRQLFIDWASRRIGLEL